MKKIEKKHLIYILISITVLIAAIFTYKYVNNKKYEEEKNIAESLYINEKYEEAIGVYESILKKYKNKEEIMKELIDTYYMTNKMDAAQSYIEKLSSKNESYSGEDRIVMSKLLNGEVQEAKSKGEEILSKSKNKELLRVMPLVYMCNNDYEKAEEMLGEFEKIVTNSNDYVDLFNMYIVTSKDKEKSYELLLQAFKKDKNNYRIYDALAQNTTYNFDKTVEELEKLTQSNPNELGYKVFLLKAYSTSIDYEDICENLLENIKKEKLEDFDIRFLEASILLQSKKEEKVKSGIELLNKAIEEEKYVDRAYNALSWFYIKEDENKAMEYYEESIKANLDYVDNYGALKYELMMASGLENGGEEEFRRAMVLDPYNYSLIMKIGQYYKSFNNFEKAIDLYKLSECMLPKDLAVKEKISQLYLDDRQAYLNKITNSSSDEEKEEYKKQLKNIDDSIIEKLHQCIHISEEKDKYYRTIGTLHITNRNYEEALKNYNKAYELNVTDVKNINNLGAYYISIDADMEKALKYLESAKEFAEKEKDKSIKQIVNENYKKIKELEKEYYLAKHKEVLTIPDFKYFY